MLLFGTDALAAAGEVTASTSFAVEFAKWSAILAGLALTGGLVSMFASPSVRVQEVYESAKTSPLWFYLLVRERLLKISERDVLLRKWEDAQVDLIDGWFEAGKINRRQRTWLYRYVSKTTGNSGLRPKLALRRLIGNRLSKKGTNYDPYKPVHFPDSPEYTPLVRSASVNELDFIYRTGKAA